MSDESPTRSLASDGLTASALPKSAEPVPPPRRVGEIELVRELGRGGMGSVWLGHDTLLRRDVAVKFLLNTPASRDDPHFENFVRSAQLASQVRSTRLTAVLSAGVHDGVPYLVMEYSPGVALSAVLHRRVALGVPLTLAIMEAICEAASDLHEGGVVHGDFKPSNVLVEHDGRVAVTDFGLAVSRPREQLTGAALGHGGTPGYMAPELLEGRATYQSDVYALGIMMYELLAGKPPFETRSGVPVDRREARVPVDRLPIDVPEAVRDVIARATEPSARLRSKSGRHMLDALHRAVRDTSVWTEGRAQLTTLLNPGVVPGVSDPGAAPSSSYYDALHALSSSHARARLEAGALTGTDTAPPDCVQPLSPTLAPVTPRVRASLACIGCTYDLRGLEPSAVCPECSTPVAESLDPDRLIFADRAWLRSLNIGMLVSFFLFWQIGAIFASRPERKDPERARAGPGPDWAENSRVTLRWCAIVGCVVLAATFADPFLPAWLSGRPMDLHWALAAVYSTAWAVWTGELARRGARVKENNAGNARARERVVRRRHRRPLATLKFHFAILAALSLAFGAAALANRQWVLPTSAVDTARTLLIVVGVASNVIAWTRTARVHTTLSDARKRRTSRAGIVGTADSSPGAGPVRDRAGRPVLTPPPVLESGQASRIPCIGCAYDLTGVVADGQCPECSTAVAETIDPERLVFADQSWLSTVRRGLKMVHGAPAMLLLGPIVYGAFVGAFGVAKSSTLTSPLFGPGIAITMVALITVCGYLGLWLATRKEPASRRPVNGDWSAWTGRSRRAVRAAVLASLALIAAEATQSLNSTWLVWLAVPHAVVNVLGALAWGVWTDDLARRSESVAKRYAGRADAARAVVRRRHRRPRRIVLILAATLVLVASGLSLLAGPALKGIHQQIQAAPMFAPIFAAGSLSLLMVWGMAGNTVRKTAGVLKGRIDRAVLLAGPTGNTSREKM